MHKGEIPCGDRFGFLVLALKGTSRNFTPTPSAQISTAEDWIPHLGTVGLWWDLSAAKRKSTWPPPLTEAIGPNYERHGGGWTFPGPCEAGSAAYVTKNFPVAVTDVATAFPKALRCATAKQKDIWFTELFLIQVVLKFFEVRDGSKSNHFD